MTDIENVLRDSEIRYQYLLKNISNVVGELDLNGTFTYVNPQVYDIFGYYPEEIIGDKFLKFIHPDDLQILKEQLKRIIKSKEKINIEFKVQHKSGNYIVVSAKVNLIKINREPKLLVVLRDISMEKEAKEKLIESKEKYKSVLKNINETYFEVDLNGDFTFLNDAISKYTGYTSEELMNKHYSQLFDVENRREISSVFNNIYKTGKGSTLFDSEIITKNREKLFVESSVYLRYDSKGEIIGFRGLVRNITERKKAEIKLKESEEKYKNLSKELEVILDNLPGLVFYKDNRNNLIRVNKYFADAHETSKENLVGKNCFDLYPKEQAQAYWDDDLEVIKSGEPKLFFEEPWDVAEGRKWVITSKIPLFNDEKGYIVGIIGFSTDITERKKAEKKLKESEQKYRNLVETSSMGLLELDVKKGGVLYVNPRLLEIVGYTQDELISKGMFYKAIYSDDYKKITKSEEDKDIELRIINKEGKIKWLSGRTLPHFNEQGELIYLRLWLQDITEAKELEEIKSNLLTRISHEFKTPLISIKGFTDLLLTQYVETLDERIISYLEIIKDGGNRLKSLINKFIESTMLGRKYLELDLNYENLSLLIKSSLRRMKGVIKMREHTIDLKIHDDLTTIFDKERIDSMFTNLLINALYYTPKGGNISIQSDIKGNSIIISVKDNGIGLSEEEMSQLFEPFGKIERYGKGWDIVSEGMGMGLYISKEIIELHGGKIWVESKGINKGSTFNFSLPLGKRRRFSKKG